jgi:uncharacterized protein
LNLSIVNVALILGVGLACGFINAIAGAGSLLTLPVLIFLGLPTAVANGTNRVAIEVQCITAVLGFRSKGVSNFKLSLLFSLPTLVGAIVGALLAINVSDALFKPILAIVMVIMLGVTFYNPAKRLKRSAVTMSPARWIAASIAFFFAGIFGGFIQAGVGFLLISILVGIVGLDLVKTNAHKVFIVAVFTLFALAIFVWGGKVNWLLGAVLAVGNGVGGWLGSRFAVTKGEKWIQAFMVLAVVGMAIKLSGIVPGW